MRQTLVLALTLVVFAGAEEAETTPEAAPSVEIPTTVDGASFFEPFLPSWESTWKVSKDADFNGRWKHESYSMGGDDKGLVVSDPARKHAVSTLFETPFDPKGKGLVIQYELQLKNGLQCGGAYIKLLTASEALSADGFKADTPYTIMFGPDKCGETNKVHFILRHKNPISGVWEEKHLTTPPIPDTTSKATHLYTAVVGVDNTVKILVDNEEKKSASLLSDTDFKPTVNPPKEIDDPEDSKPEDWVDQPKMDEPGASKPDDWDEEAPKQIADPKASKPDSWLDDAPDMVADPEALKPDDWDEEEDGPWEAPLIKNPDCAKYGCGEWKAPLISNPEYKGKWFAPKVDNPDYKGVWMPRKIENPSYFVDESPHAMAPIGGIGIELWTMQDGILFDNILLTSDPAVASGLAKKTFIKRKAIEDENKKKEERSSSLEKPEGFVGTLKYYGLKALYYAQDNPLIVAGSFFIGLIPLVLLCCFGFGGKKKDEADDDVDDDVVAADADGEEDEGEEAAIEELDEEPQAKEAEETKEEAKEEKPKASSAKKRTPKAS